MTKPLSKEVNTEYLLTVKAIDDGIPQLSSSVSVKVVIYGATDNPPEFQFKVYNTTVSENIKKGSDVLQVHATSQATGLYAQVFYSISGGNEDRKFRIDSKTG